MIDMKYFYFPVTSAVMDIDGVFAEIGELGPYQLKVRAEYVLFVQTNIYDPAPPNEA